MIKINYSCFNINILIINNTYKVLNWYNISYLKVIHIKTKNNKFQGSFRFVILSLPTIKV